MTNWKQYKENQLKPYDHSSLQGGMVDLLMEFPTSVRQAMYAAANKGTIRKNTWNNCGLNAAGSEMGLGVTSFKAATRLGITFAQAKRFVYIWDALSGTNEESTEWLKEQILQAGLFEEPGRRLPRIVRKRVHVSEQTRLKEEFEALMEANNVPNTEEALELFSWNVSDFEAAGV